MADLRALVRRAIPAAGLDPFRSVDRAVYVTGTGRSGTTWVAQVLQEALGARLVFEPLHHRSSLRHVPHLRGPGSVGAELATGIRRALDGSLRDPHVDRFARRRLHRCRVVKDIRPGLLPAVREVAPRVPVVHVVRHPLDVAVSRMSLERDGRNWWDGDRVVDELQEHARGSDRTSELARRALEVIDEEPTGLAPHVAVWCVENAVASHAALEPGVRVRYEDLVRSPEEHFGAVGEVIGTDLGDVDALRRPSKTAFRSEVGRLDKWRDDVGEGEAARLLAIPERFGLGGLYPSG